MQAIFKKKPEKRFFLTEYNLAEIHAKDLFVTNSDVKLR